MTLVYIVLILIAVFALVKLIDKFVPQSKRWIFTLLFWAIALFTGWKLYQSIMAPIVFKQVKKERYAKVINNLKDIRKAEVAYKTVNGKYTDNWDDLVKFIETGEYTITQRKDSSIVDVELTKRYGGVEMRKDIVIIDTIGTASVKDSIFKNSDRYKKMMFIPGVEGQKFEIKAGTIEKGDSKLPVFEVKVAKDLLLKDQPEHLVALEKETVSIDAVNGDAIVLGSMNEVTTNGNWPRSYDEDE